MIKFSQSCREGFSLLEVLISVFVVLIGLLGVATMIPAARYEMLQARKVDMGADLSRAVLNSVVSQLGTTWNPTGNNPYYIVASEGTLAENLISGFGKMGLNFQKVPVTFNNNRTLNGDDDLALISDDNGQIQLSFENNEAIGTGAYTAFATIVPLGNGFYEVTGGVAYRYTPEEEKVYQRGSYVFTTDKYGKYHWYKAENVYGKTVTTTAGDKSEPGFLGDVVGICKKVVRIDNVYSN